MFPGYYQPTEEEFTELWAKGLIVLDTNVLLGLYRYSPETRNRVISTLEHEKFRERLWIPHQTGWEYQRNRLKVISEQQKAYQEAQALPGEWWKALEEKLQSKKHPFIHNEEELLDKIKDLFAEIKQAFKAGSQDIPTFIEDNIQDTITSLFAGKVGEPYAPERYDEIFKEGKDESSAKRSASALIRKTRINSSHK